LLDASHVLVPRGRLPRPGHDQMMNRKLEWNTARTFRTVVYAMVLGSVLG
jgi:hypothetical protein